MDNWSSLALVSAAILAVVWLYLARTMVKLRSEYVRLHPSTGEPVQWPPGSGPSEDLGPETVIRLGDHTEPVYYLGALVSRWDQLPPVRQQRLSLFHKLAGIGVVFLAAVGLLSWALF